MDYKILGWPLAVALSASAGHVIALELDADLDTTIEYTDNARRGGGNGSSEVQEYIAVAVSGEHAGEALVADFQYRADRRFYNSNSQSDESALEGFASLTWEQIDEALFWNLSHRRKDVLRDSALVDIRENRDERDITEVSPQLVLRLSPVDTVQAALNYSMITYQEADLLDSDRYGGTLTWAHRLSPVDGFDVALETSEVDFDSELQDDYRYDAATVSYGSRLARINYRITVGYNRADRDSGNNFSAPLYALDAQYSHGGNVWHVGVDSRISDSSLGDGNQYIFDSVDIADTTLGSVDIIKKTRFEAGLTTPFLCSVCTSRAVIYFDQEDYDVRPRDNEEYGLELGTDFRVTGQSVLFVTYSYRSIEYQGDQQIIDPIFDVLDDDFFLPGEGIRADYDEHRLQFRYGYRFTQALSGDAFVEYSTRSSNEGVHDYDEMRIGFRLSYDFY